MNMETASSSSKYFSRTVYSEKSERLRALKSQVFNSALTRSVNKPLVIERGWYKNGIALLGCRKAHKVSPMAMTGKTVIHNTVNSTTRPVKRSIV